MTYPANQPPAIAQRASGLAVASLCLALVSVLLMFSGILQLGLITCVIGTVLGVVALSNITHNKQLRGKGMAWTGIGLSVVLLAITFVMWLQIMAERY